MNRKLFQSQETRKVKIKLLHRRCFLASDESLRRLENFVIWGWAGDRGRMVVPEASIWRINIHLKINSLSVSPTTLVWERQIERCCHRKMPLCRGVTWQMLMPKFGRKYFSRRIQCELWLVFHFQLGDIIKHRRRTWGSSLKCQRWCVSSIRV